MYQFLIQVATFFVNISITITSYIEVYSKIMYDYFVKFGFFEFVDNSYILTFVNNGIQTMEVSYVNKQKMIESILLHKKIDDKEDTLIYLEHNKKNKIFATYQELVDEIIENETLNEVNYKFLQILLVYKTKLYYVILDKKLTYNFYVENNKINSDFIKYYMVKYLNISEVDVKEDTDFSYELKIIDDDVNTINITNYEYIILKKNKYEIVYRKP